MKNALIQIAHTALTKWGELTALLCTNSDCTRFPIIVAQTTEGQIMDGPRGLQLITHQGPTPVQQTHEGFVVYKPFRHLLQPTSGLNRILQKQSQ